MDGLKKTYKALLLRLLKATNLIICYKHGHIMSTKVNQIQNEKYYITHLYMKAKKNAELTERT